MSFLNPVSEPVLRFKSTDAGAPQINYNSRVAGDVKAVLKACLVTGYGAKSSAGWSIANEVNHVAEFVSPAAAMSDYRYKIDDTSSIKTTWGYFYKDAAATMTYNEPIKNFTSINKTHSDNGWQLFATPKGFLFVEVLHFSKVTAPAVRLTYIGQIKSGLVATNEENVYFFSTGLESPIGDPRSFFTGSYTHTKLAGKTDIKLMSLSPQAAAYTYFYEIDGGSVMDVIAPFYFYTASLTLAQLPCMLSMIANQSTDLWGISDIVVGGVSYCKVTAAFNTSTTGSVMQRSYVYLIPTDNWGY